MKTMFFAACALVGAAFADVEWNLAECFNDLSFTRCKGTLENGVLVMTDIERDAYFTLYNVQVDPTGLDTLEFKYRATDIGKSGGQFYYCHEGVGDSDLRRSGRATSLYSGAWRLDVPFARDTFSAPLHTSHLFYYGDDAEELWTRIQQ